MEETDAAQTQPQWLGVVVVDQEPEDAYQVADRCIAEWDAFLRHHGLLASGHVSGHTGAVSAS